MTLCEQQKELSLAFKLLLDECRPLALPLLRRWWYAFANVGKCLINDSAHCMFHAKEMGIPWVAPNQADLDDFILQHGTCVEILGVDEYCDDKL